MTHAPGQNETSTRKLPELGKTKTVSLGQGNVWWPCRSRSDSIFSSEYRSRSNFFPSLDLKLDVVESSYRSYFFSNKT